MAPNTALVIIGRQATLADRPALEALALAFAQTPPYGQLFPDVDPDRVTALVDTVLKMPDALVIIVEAAGVPVGAMAIVESQHPLIGPFADELFWYINPQLQRGVFDVAPKLFELAYRWARSRGLERIRMTAPAGGKLGKLYQRHGYRPVEMSYVKGLTGVD